MGFVLSLRGKEQQVLGCRSIVCVERRKQEHTHTLHTHHPTKCYKFFLVALLGGGEDSARVETWRRSCVAISSTYFRMSNKKSYIQPRV